MPELIPDETELRLILKQIETHPGTWDQSTWGTRNLDCGTSFCFAGHAVARAGYTIHWERVVDDDPTNLFATECSAVGEMELELIDDAAREILGLTVWQADELFSATNTLDDIRNLVEEFCHGE